MSWYHLIPVCVQAENVRTSIVMDLKWNSLSVESRSNFKVPDMTAGSSDSVARALPATACRNQNCERLCMQQHEVGYLWQVQIVCLSCWISSQVEIPAWALTQSDGQAFTSWFCLSSCLKCKCQISDLSLCTRLTAYTLGPEPSSPKSHRSSTLILACGYSTADGYFAFMLYASSSCWLWLSSVAFWIL